MRSGYPLPGLDITTRLGQRRAKERHSMKKFKTQICWTVCLYHPADANEFNVGRTVFIRDLPTIIRKVERQNALKLSVWVDSKDFLEM